jgi:hypothetical protein
MSDSYGCIAHDFLAWAPAYDSINGNDSVSDQAFLQRLNNVAPTGKQAQNSSSWGDLNANRIAERVSKN